MHSLYAGAMTRGKHETRRGVPLSPLAIPPEPPHARILAVVTPALPTPCTPPDVGLDARSRAAWSAPAKGAGFERLVTSRMQQDISSYKVQRMPAERTA